MGTVQVLLSISSMYLLGHQHTKKNLTRIQRWRPWGEEEKLWKSVTSKTFKVCRKLVFFLVGQVREGFSFFTVTECIALVIEACQYKINTSCSSLIIVLLPDFCIAKTKDDSASSSEVSPVIDSTNSRSRTEIIFLKKESSLYAAFISGLQWSGADNTKAHITLSVPSTQAFSLRNQEINTWALPK